MGPHLLCRSLLNSALEDTCNGLSPVLGSVAEVAVLSLRDSIVELHIRVWSNLFGLCNPFAQRMMA